MREKNQTIYLTGFMGSGKTSVAKNISTLLGLPWIDLDHIIEKKTGKTILRFFAKLGEKKFRHLEHRLLIQITHNQPMVVSLGGGIILEERNRALLRKKIWIHLFASPAIIQKRLKSNQSRPLLKRKKNESIETLWKKRLPLYNEAPIRIDTNGLTPYAVAKKIVRLLKG
ncbi:MAG: hypothetical protein A3G32_10275 [Deltaproteobacteria bacterium RIFCSPLOWO2_12_FULL_40_28]|nr:MAG: hypothetical protein A3C45_05285 [Deltaproteobacteria bacterium RIFCSPHIGHO2_02_FULL_40_28]OGQ20412.1 MAG: hypothetical protein A3E27_00665 [Deltaproteobacteria bacterium RIFCSPHIGHO2_12_FULL_40_32]OGQ41381.1 MAG: hypothetical protein A3I69_02315 [Deltaproteobacteria bacterium RIFCSPLOWO2_02_FULL_40_36]OGQ55020.1 MAG: hypothetical protein A3G32_10275 [Deltaproteobacteria bacterium RIFCSPLOWO2_12_FULL_40_28]